MNLSPEFNNILDLFNAFSWPVQWRLAYSIVETTPPSWPSVQYINKIISTQYIYISENRACWAMQNQPRKRVTAREQSTVPDVAVDKE